MSISITVAQQSFPLAEVFRISRGAKTSAEVVTVTISDGDSRGWGESVPYARYNETPTSVVQQIESFAAAFSAEDVGCEDTLKARIAALPAGSARNALDCAMWDFSGNKHKRNVSQIADLPRVTQCITAQTLSIDTTEVMAKAAQKLRGYPLIKVKLDGDFVLAKMDAIHKACPDSQFIIDANEAWDMKLLEQVVGPLSKMNVALIEQPLPAEDDQQLEGFYSPIPLCADESCHTSDNLAILSKRYQAVNIKLDKTGGLSEAIKLQRQAKAQNMKVMIGCMVGSSLAMAPAFYLCAQADFVDLDGPTLVAEDRENGFVFENGHMSLPKSLLWGQGGQ